MYMAGESKPYFAPWLGKHFLILTLSFADNQKDAWLSHVALRPLHPSDEDSQRILRAPTLVKSRFAFTGAVLIIR